MCYDEEYALERNLFPWLDDPSCEANELPPPADPDPWPATCVNCGEAMECQTETGLCEECFDEWEC